MSVYRILFVSLSPPPLPTPRNLPQVVEIATYTDHVLTECEAKSNFGKCPRCSEAIPVVELDQHIADKTCNRKPQCHALFVFFLFKKKNFFLGETEISKDASWPERVQIFASARFIWLVS